MKRRIVVLISGSGTNLQALIDAVDTPALPNAQITLVLSNRKTAYGLTRAAQSIPPIPTAYLALKPYLNQNPGATREDYDAEIAKIVLREQPDIVVLAGWMHILGDGFLELVDGRKRVDELSVTKPIAVINLHPALPDQFDGAGAIERAYEAFQKGEIAYSGAMVHRVVKDVDKGEPIIVRQVGFVKGESIEEYGTRLHLVEHEIIVQATAKVLGFVGKKKFSKSVVTLLQRYLLPPFLKPLFFSPRPDFCMAIGSFSRHSGEEVVQETYPATLLPPPKLSLCESMNSPRLEVSEVGVVPFSHNFLDLFEGLGLDISEPEATEDRPDFSYDIENFTNIRDIDSEWHHDGIEEIIVMSSKRPSALSTIQEDYESSPVLAPIAALSDFDFDETDSLCKEGATSGNICTKRDTGKKYVIKSRKAYTGSVWTEQAIIECLTELSLPFTPHMRWTFQSGEQIYMITDYYPNGSLVDFINTHGSLGSHRALFYAAELVSVIASLHDVGVVHRDLNPANVMLDAEGHLVLTNFDSAEFFPASANTRRTASTTAFERGLTQYQAPEILLGWAHNSAVDCWGFGMLLYFLFFGTHPFGRKELSEDKSMVHNRIIQCPIPMESLRLVQPMARDLVLQCLERNPALRWDMAQIKKHAYFYQVDWRQVSTKGLEVPFFGIPTVAPDFGTLTDEQRRPISLNTSSLLDKDRSTLHQHCSDVPIRRSQTMKGISRIPLMANILSNNTETFKSVKKTIPVIIEEEEKTTSELGTMGHTAQTAKDEIWEEISHTERMSRLWDNFGDEEKASAASINSGERMGIPLSKAPKLRKHRSSIHPQQRFFNLSTSSFHKKLRMKPRSTSALRSSKPVEPIPDLPNGIHQLGSGIGFTYNVPTAISSKLSVSSFAPANCQSIFHGGFSLNLGLGLGNVTRKAKRNQNEVVAHSQTICEPDLDQDIGVQDARLKDAGNATFIRDMYRTPSWILSPPDSVPSPMVLVTSDSPVSESEEACSPITMVDSEEDTEVNITIPKHLDLEYEFPHGTPDSTLRLVPSSPVLMKSPAMPAVFEGV